MCQLWGHENTRVSPLLLYTERLSCAFLGLMNNFCTVLCCGTSGAAWLHHTAPAPHLHSIHTHTHTHTRLKSPTPRPLAAPPSRAFLPCQLLPWAKGCNKLLSPFWIQHRFVSIQWPITSSARLTCDETKTIHMKLVCTKLNECGLMSFRFKLRREERWCWNVSSFLEWQVCWCADLCVLWLKGWGEQEGELSGFSEWKKAGLLKITEISQSKNAFGCKANTNLFKMSGLYCHILLGASSFLCKMGDRFPMVFKQIGTFLQAAIVQPAVHLQLNKGKPQAPVLLICEAKHLLLS